MPHLDGIQFGLARAELEAAKFPILLTDGFLDNRNIVDKLVHQHPFLVLGYKGSGKSAVAEKLNLLAHNNHNFITKLVHLGDFPFKSFGQIMPGKAEVEAKFPTSWSWLLLLMLIDSISQDQAVVHDPDLSLMRSVNTMRDMGLLPANDVKQLVLMSSKHSFKGQIPKIIEATSEITTTPVGLDLQLVHLVEQLKRLIAHTATPNKHVLIIDGLDDILTTRTIQYQSIAALVFEADRLNIEFMKTGAMCKILVLCRTDLFEKLPGPNKNKLRQDSAVELDWYHDSRDPEHSDLIALSDLRTKLSLGPNVLLFDHYFPAEINGKSTAHFLLDHTRHTPRDYIQLLNHLKQYALDMPMTKSQILSGIGDYSKNYFLPEVRDELVGYHDEELFDRILKTIGSFRDREISYGKLLATSRLKLGIDEAALQAILEDLFNCSAIGNKSQRMDGIPRYYFKYRNRNDSISFDDSIVIHWGMWKALNLV
jgi:hypothetical protein